MNMKNLKKYISANAYNEEMVKKVEPYLHKYLKSGYVLGQKNLKLYYEEFIVKNSKASIVICHGLGEVTEKYNELIYYFIKEGYSVFIIEHRGHGRSQKLGMDNSQIHVEKFDYYVEDFKKFIDEIVIPHSDNNNLLLFAHSMGGGIGTVFLEKYRSYFKAAILNSPMHKISTGKVPEILACIISMTMKFCGMKIRYLPGQKPYKKEKKFTDKATMCKERYNYICNKIKNNDLYQSGGISANWYVESLNATRKLIKKKNASKVTIPVLLFQAEDDMYVIGEAQNKFASYAQNCKLICVKGSRHESYFERDEILFGYLDKVLSFYESTYK